MKFERPKFERPKFERPKFKGPSIDAPKPVADVYRDLRERHLLIVVVALLVAIVAVPLALGKKSEPAPAAATPPTSSQSAEMTMPAVTLADVPGITNYRKRLANFESKNPFKAQFAVPTDTSTGTGSGSGSSPFPTGSSGGAPTGTTPSTPPSDTTSTTQTTTTPPPDNGNGNNGGGNGGQTKPTIKTVTQLFTRRVDVTVAKVGGESRQMRSVEPMTILPNETNPALAFLGTDENGTNAAFVLSSRSIATGGNASCVPSPDNCIYVTMKEGDTLTVAYTPEGATEPVTYNVTLNKIRDVNVKEPQKAAHPAQAPAYASTGENGG